METYMNFADTVGNSFNEEEEGMQLCHTCNCENIDNAKVALAERFCIKCEEKLCISCSQEHKTKRDHLVVALYDQKETKKFKESELCAAHTERVTELYCICCREVICSECEKESHSSHNCSSVEKAAILVSTQAETEYENLSDIQLHFEKEREKFSSEENRVIKTVKEMEKEIRKRCDEMTRFVCSETNSLLKELGAFRKERLEEIEMERRKMEEHAFTFEKFREYCDQIKSNVNPKYTCEAEGVLRNIADDLKTRPESRWKNKLFSTDVSIKKTDTEQVLTSLSDAVGKLIIRCPHKIKQSSLVELDGAKVYDMAILHDKLYLLSNSIVVLRLQYLFASVGEIETPEIKSPKEIVSCPKTSCLYIYDNGEECVWKVSIPNQQVCRWLTEVKEPCAISVTSNAELLLLRNNKPVCLEVYNEDAILSRRLNFPAVVIPLCRLYETSSGGYIGQAGSTVATFRENGSLIGQFDPAEQKECMGNLLCFDLSPYHIFLHCENDGQQDKMSSSQHSTIPSVKATPPITFARSISSTRGLRAFGQARLPITYPNSISSTRGLRAFGRARLPITYANSISSTLFEQTISSVSADLAHHQTLVNRIQMTSATPVKSRYIKGTKKLLVLEKDVSNITTTRMLLKVWDVLPA